MTKKSDNNDQSGYKLLALLRQTTDAVFKVRQKELKVIGVTPEQSAALAVIHALGDNAIASEVSRVLFRKPNSITILLRRLEKQGLIKKKPDKYRKNVIKLSLTDKGMKCYLSASKLDGVRDIMNQLPLKQRQQLWVYLEKIRNSALENVGVNVENYTRITGRLSPYD